MGLKLSFFLIVIFAISVFSATPNVDSLKKELSLFSDDSYKLRLQADINSLLDKINNCEYNDHQIILIKQKLDELIKYSLEQNKQKIEQKLDDIIASAKYNDEFAGCENMHDDALLRRLHDITGKHYTSIGYTAARKVVFTFIDNDNGKVEDIYTGRVKRISHGTPNSSDMNIEHVWPQSHGATGVAKSDMHHLFPCDSKANCRRANYPFGIVSDEDIHWSQAGSKLGNHIFEPRNKVKGDVARATFYFAMRYNMHIENGEEAVLRAWSKMDPVDEHERTRERRVHERQGNSNPFVLHPELVNQIADF